MNDLEKITTTSEPSKEIKTFPNPYVGRDFEINIECPEFTCLCPMTGQPDFAKIYISYIPDKLCIELKSLKLYLWSYRNEGAFHEKVTNQILDDIVKVIAPKNLIIKTTFNVRGGIYTSVKVSYSGGTRPWGNYEILTENQGYKVKRITVLPKEELSDQRHFRRDEFWTVVNGNAHLTLEGKIKEEKEMFVGKTAFIPKETWHHLKNNGEVPFVFIEVQNGDYLEEDDIERRKDKYGRM